MYQTRSLYANHFTPLSTEFSNLFELHSFVTFCFSEQFLAFAIFLLPGDCLRDRKHLGEKGRLGLENDWNHIETRVRTSALPARSRFQSSPDLIGL